MLDKIPNDSMKKAQNIQKGLKLVESLVKLGCAFTIHHTVLRGKKNLCLIGSNYGMKRNDNAQALFNFIDKQKKIQILFVENQPKGKKAIKRGSLKSYIYFFSAKLVFFSHSLSDILPQLHRASFLFKMLHTPLKIFIQHGVTAMTGLKKVDRYFRKNHSSFDYVLVTSEIEKKIIHDIGIERKKIKITGFPIHDHAFFGPRKKSVLIFFTWEKDQKYLLKLHEIVTDKSILSILRNYGYELIVHHHNMMPKSNYRIMADGRKKDEHDHLKKAIDSARILITDNSSVAWDFFYSNCDVIFYKPRSDTRTDLLKAGYHVAYDTESLSILLQSAFLNNLPLTKTQGFFAFKDRKNCERVYNLFRHA